MYVGMQKERGREREEYFSEENYRKFKVLSHLVFTGKNVKNTLRPFVKRSQGQNSQRFSEIHFSIKKQISWRDFLGF